MWVKFNTLQPGSLSNIVEIFCKAPRSVPTRNVRGSVNSKAEQESENDVFDRVCDRISRVLASDPNDYFENSLFHVSDSSSTVSPSTSGTINGGARLCIQFESTEHAVKGCAKIVSALAQTAVKKTDRLGGDREKENITPRNVEIREHSVVKGCYEGRGLPFARMIEKLSATYSQSLPEFVVSALNSLPKKPLLLSVQQVTPLTSSQSKSTEEDVLVIICAASYDLQVLLKQGSIDLIGNARLHFLKQTLTPERVRNSGRQTAAAREVYVIW